MSAVTAICACRICGNQNLEVVLDLGEQALTGVFPKARDAKLTAGPLKLVRCSGGESTCGLVQLAHTYDLDEMYGDQYGYRSGLNRSMVHHLTSKVEWLQRRRPLRAGELVLDIGSNDGTTLGQYPESIVRVGIDPTTDKFRQFHKPGIRAVADFFSADAYDRIAGSTKASIITSISMFYDLPAPMRFVEDIAQILADDGIWHLEQSYLPSMLRTNSYDTVCHEHLEYYSLSQIDWMVTRCGMRITDVQFNDINGGSFAVTVEKGSAHSESVQKLLLEEAFLKEETTWPSFRRRVENQRSELRETLTNLKAEGKRVVGLGASTKGNVVLQYCNITPDLLDCIAEVNPDKFGAFTPGTGIPIRSEEEALALRPDVMLVLPWHFRQTFLSKQAAWEKSHSLRPALLFPLPLVELAP